MIDFTKQYSFSILTVILVFVTNNGCLIEDVLINDTSSVFPLICPNGTPKSGTHTIENTKNCSSCDKNFILDNKNQCVASLTGPAIGPGSRPFTITSNKINGGFKPGEAIDSTFTNIMPRVADSSGNMKGSQCNGRNEFPKLSWSNIPQNTKALVLVVDDPDGHDWVHLKAVYTLLKLLRVQKFMEQLFNKKIKL